ncbi:hypothetical protein A3G50_02305 [Candidatus Jorgensenbacteria bacterium RIFCSPLOWO2_12_FULL_42_11]|uniref:HTH HARE-type domain-containing protein n=1 Tax=Candidatus Jorgensenbacteria bacterium RIFCSPLOWO2_12_FULL_42_11 TaxID=1798473 RepID=A0A1F6C1G9_9BACT|nr:MAG: hypothetical protein A3G50_02305 [Candidatus Jorgensenbacteria bacterium RIFCSPLOWO2_12_FULL_42_11]
MLTFDFENVRVFLRMIKELDNFINSHLSNLEKRQREILTERFGFKDGEKKTLQAIGDIFGITRERVRQIENQGMEKLKIQPVREQIGKLIEPLKQHLASAGGLKRDDLFIQDAKGLTVAENWPKFFDNKLRFIFLINNEPKFSEASDNLYDFWYLDEKTKTEALKRIKEFFGFCQKSGPEKIIDRKIHLARFQDLMDINYLSLSKNFNINVFGDFGLSSWPEINPRVVSDKAYLVLKKNNRPLHFRDISQKINDLKFDHKEAHPQTVHNELIRDNRFVLVGRGIYGLREQGYEPGTAREVLVRILKKHGPLDAQKIIQLVQKERFLRENTIFLNLQNKRCFEKLPDNRYTLIREA